MTTRTFIISAIVICFSGLAAPLARAIVGNGINAHSIPKAPVIKTLVIDEPDRLTEEEFAREHGRRLAEVQKRYAASGRLACKGWFPVSAQLTLRNNLVATAAHIVIDKNTTCHQYKALDDCEFIVAIGDRKRRSRIKKIIATGWGAECPHDTTGDWLIAELESPIEGIEPYSLGAVEEIRPGKAITDVHATNADLYWKDASGHYHYPKTIGLGEIKDVYTVGWYNGVMPDYISTNADSALGASGGAVLDDFGAHPLLLGVQVASTETEPELGRAIVHGKPNRCSYERMTCASYSVPVAGYFRDALLKAAAELQ